jgi:hypothetical protein
MGTVSKGMLVLAFSLQSTGCYQWVAIRPSELPKLDNDGAQPAAERNVRNARLERPDGSLVEVNRSSDVRLETASESLELAAPVVARIQKDELWIRAGNAGNMKFVLSDVKSAEVAKFDGGMTAVAIVGAVLGTTLVTTLLVVGLTHESMK